MLNRLPEIGELVRVLGSDKVYQVYSVCSPETHGLSTDCVCRVVSTNQASTVEKAAHFTQYATTWEWVEESFEAYIERVREEAGVHVNDR